MKSVKYTRGNINLQVTHVIIAYPILSLENNCQFQIECNRIRYGILELIQNYKTEHTKPRSTQFLRGFN